MKRIALGILLIFGFQALAQDKEEVSINDFSFESTTNPAFTLLEESPTQIETPDNLKSLALYLSNGFSNTNIALEVNPYWFFDSDNRRSYSRYRGFRTKKEGNGVKQYINPLHGLSTKTSISLGYIDKQFEGFESENKVVAVGFRTTLLEFYNADRRDAILNVILQTAGDPVEGMNAEYRRYISAVEPNLPLPDDRYCAQDVTDSFLKPYLDLAQKFLTSKGITNMTKEELLKGYLDERCKIIQAFVDNEKEIKPLFRLDGAFGYSWLFKQNDFDAPTANRLASWLTADVALDLKKNGYIHIMAIGKYVDDGFVVDSEGVFSDTNFWDYGAKVELEINKFKLSYEYLERSGDGDKFRSVGNITYQLSKDMILVGGFGKDFPVDDNLVSILGINWGLDSGEKAFNQQ